MGKARRKIRHGLGDCEYGRNVGMDVRSVRRFLPLLSAAAVLFAPGVVEAKTFTTVGESTYVVSAGVTHVAIQAIGGRGGQAWGSTCDGGFGAVVTGTLQVTPGQTLYVEVGGQGGAATSIATAGTPGRTAVGPVAPAVVAVAARRTSGRCHGLPVSGPTADR